MNINCSLPLTKREGIGRPSEKFSRLKSIKIQKSYRHNPDYQHDYSEAKSKLKSIEIELFYEL